MRGIIGFHYGRSNIFPAPPLRVRGVAYVFVVERHAAAAAGTILGPGNGDGGFRAPLRSQPFHVIYSTASGRASLLPLLWLLLVPLPLQTSSLSRSLAPDAAATIARKERERRGDEILEGRIQLLPEREQTWTDGPATTAASGVLAIYSLGTTYHRRTVQ